VWNSVNSFYSTNAHNIDHLLAFPGIFLIRREEGQRRKKKAHLITALMYTVSIIMRQLVNA